MEEQKYSHESYCLVYFSRRQGFPKLFASALEKHSSYITLQIKKATLVRTGNGDRFDSGISGDIIEVDLSPAQFSELLTTMNIGLGVPGTLRRLLNKRVEEPPEIIGEVENIHESFISELLKFKEDILGNKVLRARKLLIQKTLTKLEREELLKMFESVSDKLGSYIPFIIEMINEATVRRITAAKLEIDSLLTTVLTKAGIKKLTE